jgi:hypothetical protein
MSTNRTATTESASQPTRAASSEAASAAPGALAQRLGNENLQLLLCARLLQTKLSVSNPEDAYEQEADRVADQVMRMPASAPQVATHAAPVVQRICSKCEEELQRSEESAAVPTVDAALESSIGSLSGRGDPLPRSVRSFMEPRFNADFSAIRVHTDAHAHELARAVSAQAFTVGRNVVFGAGHYSPETETGKRLLAHELTHTIQQRGATEKISRSPDSLSLNSDFECAASELHPNSEPLPARTWLRCYRRGNIRLDTEGVFRWVNTGEMFTEERLIEWAMNQSTSQATMVAQIRNSHAFSGNTEIREHAARTLTLATQQVPLEERRQEREDEHLAQKEAERQKQVAAERARARQKERDRHSGWIAGDGTINRPTLATPRSPHQDRSGGVTFQTYDYDGELKTQKFPNTDAYASSVREQLEALQKRCKDLPEEVFARYKLDRKMVAEVLSDAAWYQRPGLALPGVNMGFSKVAIEHGVIAAKYATMAASEAKAALHELDEGHGTQAAQKLNEARLLLFQAKHSLHKMIRTRDDDADASLNALENYSKAGDYAAMALPAPLQVGLSTLKNAGVRLSTMHSDPRAEFGFGSFAWQTAVSIASVKGQKLLVGTNPTFMRAFSAGVATNQVSKALLAGDASKLLEFNATELAFAGAGAVHSALVTRARAAQATRPSLTPPTSLTPMTELPATTHATEPGLAPKAPSPMRVKAVSGGGGGNGGGGGGRGGNGGSDGTVIAGPDADTTPIRRPATPPPPRSASGEIHSPASVPEHVPDDSAAIRAIHTPGSDPSRLSQTTVIRYLRSLNNPRINQLLGPIERGEGRIIFNLHDQYGHPDVDGHIDPIDPATGRASSKNIYINFDRAVGLDASGAVDLTRDPILAGAVTGAHELDHVDQDFSQGYNRGHELQSFQTQRLVDPSSVLESDIALKQWIDQNYSQVPAPPGWYDDHHQMYPIPPGGLHPPNTRPRAVSGANKPPQPPRPPPAREEPAVLYSLPDGVRMITVRDGRAYYRSTGKSTSHIDGQPTVKVEGAFYEFVGALEAEPPVLPAHITDPQFIEDYSKIHVGWLTKGPGIAPTEPVPELQNQAYRIENNGVPIASAEQLNAWLVSKGMVPWIDYFRHSIGLKGPPSVPRAQATQQQQTRIPPREQGVLPQQTQTPTRSPGHGEFDNEPTLVDRHRLPAIIFKGKGLLPGGKVDHDRVILVLDGRPVYLASGESPTYTGDPTQPIYHTAGEAYRFHGVQEGTSIFGPDGWLIKFVHEGSQFRIDGFHENYTYSIEGTLETSQQINAWLRSRGASPYNDPFAVPTNMPSR